MTPDPELDPAARERVRLAAADPEDRVRAFLDARAADSLPHPIMVGWCRTDSGEHTLLAADVTALLNRLAAARTALGTRPGVPKPLAPPTAREVHGHVRRGGGMVEAQVRAVLDALAEVMGPCGCPVGADQEHGHPHTVLEHDRDSCVSAPPCGGCYSCLAMQRAHYDRLRAEEDDRVQASLSQQAAEAEEAHGNGW